MKTYTTFQTAKILKIAYPRMREWIIRGHIVPSVPSDGQGSKALFNIQDIYLIRLFMHIFSLGFSREEAAQRVNDFELYRRAVKQTHKRDFIYNYVMLINRPPGSDKPRTVIIDDGWFETRSLKNLLDGNEFEDAVVVNIGQLCREVDGKIANLKP